MAQMMIPLALCCAAVSSSSLAMQFMGGLFGGLFGGLGGLFDTSKLTGTIKKAPTGAACKPWCGDCSQADYVKMVNTDPNDVASAAEAEALCKGNRSGFSGSQEAWDAYMRGLGPNCCT